MNAIAQQKAIVLAQMFAVTFLPLSVYAAPLSWEGLLLGSGVVGLLVLGARRSRFRRRLP